MPVEPGSSDPESTGKFLFLLGQTKAISEIDIWTGVISPYDRDMSAPEANAVLGWEFNDQAKQRMDELATRNGQGTLTDSEKEELEAYVHVGQVIAILQAKARLSLQRSSGNGSD